MRIEYRKIKEGMSPGTDTEILIDTIGADVLWIDTELSITRLTTVTLEQAGHPARLSIVLSPSSVAELAQKLQKICKELDQ